MRACVRACVRAFVCVWMELSESPKDKGKIKSISFILVSVMFEPLKLFCLAFLADDKFEGSNTFYQSIFNCLRIEHFKEVIKRSHIYLRVHSWNPSIVTNMSRYALQFPFASTYTRTHTHTSTQWPSRLGLQNTLTASLQRGKTPSTSVLDLTLNNLMVRLQ